MNQHQEQDRDDALRELLAIERAREERRDARVGILRNVAGVALIVVIILGIRAVIGGLG